MWSLIWVSIAVSCMYISCTAESSSPASSLPSPSPSPSPSDGPSVSPAPGTVLPTPFPVPSKPSPSPSLGPENAPTYVPITPPSSAPVNTLLPSTRPSSPLTPSPTVSRKILLERVMTEVTVEMASVQKLMDYPTQRNLENTLNNWLESYFQNHDPPIYGISTLITSQHINVNSTPRTSLRSLQNISGYKITIRLILSGYFQPSPLFLSAADVNFEQSVSDLIQDHQQIHVLLKYITNDPLTYFSNVFLFQAPRSTSASVNPTSSSKSFHDVVSITVGTVGGFVGSVLAIVLILVLRDRRRRRGIRLEKYQSFSHSMNTQPNTPDRDFAPSSAIHMGFDAPSTHSHMDDLDGSIMDMTNFSAIIRHHHHQGTRNRGSSDEDNDDDAEMKFRYDGIYSDIITSDSFSLPSYSGKNRSLATGVLKLSPDTNVDSEHRNDNDTVTLTRLDNDSIIPLSIIQELCEFKFEDDQASCSIHVPPCDDKTDNHSTGSSDSMSLITYENYSVAGVSCIRTVREEQKDVLIDNYSFLSGQSNKDTIVIHQDDQELNWNYSFDGSLDQRSKVEDVNPTGSNLSPDGYGYPLNMNYSFDESLTRISTMVHGSDDKMGFNRLWSDSSSLQEPKNEHVILRFDESNTRTTAGSSLAVVSCINAMGFFNDDEGEEQESSHQVDDNMDNQSISLRSIDMYSIAAETLYTRE